MVSEAEHRGTSYTDVACPLRFADLDQWSKIARVGEPGGQDMACCRCKAGNLAPKLS